MKFMHISDVHLGVKPDKGSSWSEKRAQDIWDSFAETIYTAQKEKTDFLLISGDLFHSQPLKKELKEVNYLFSQIPETKVILMAGNHDYIQQKSFYRTYPWEKNVYFFQGEEVTFFDFPEENAAVYGASYWHREIKDALYDNVIPENQERINILLAHGGDENHIPFSAQRILQNGFDYVAAGHIHKGEQLIANRAVMAGALEPIDCNEAGSHGYWMGTLEKQSCEVHFFPIKKCEYRHETMAVEKVTTERQMLEWAKKLLLENPKYCYYRINFEGYADPDVVYDFTRIRELPGVVDVSEHLVPDYNYEKIQAENEHSLLGKYIQTMQGKSTDAVTKKALEYGVNALLGHQICR